MIILDVDHFKSLNDRLIENLVRCGLLKVDVKVGDVALFSASVLAKSLGKKPR